MASLLGALLVGVPGAAPSAAAPLSQTSIITNNIQGASTTAAETRETDSKWTTMVDGFIRNAPIVLLQEAGPSGPPGSTELPIYQTADGDSVRHFQWPVDHSRAQVFFLQTDSNAGTAVGGRVNIAIVTRDMPDQVRVVRNPVTAGRAALGVRFGNNWYFSIHGLSGGGNDSMTLLEEIDSAVDEWSPSYTYTIGGDFNREPAALRNQGNGLPPGAGILASGQPTHEQGGELDYFVSNDRTQPPVGAHRLNGAQSDHYPVMIGAMQAAAEPPDLSMMISGDGIYGSTPDKALLGMEDWYNLAAVGSYKRSVDFVGSGTSSGGTPEEGAAGEEISAIAARDATAVAKYKPNVVLLQAGTWDLQDGDQSGASDRLSALIDQIHNTVPSTVVLVATLDPTTNAADEALVTAYNTAVGQLVAAKVAAGRRVVLANMSALTTADLNADGVTPNDSGQQKIADTFTGALIWAMVMGWISQPASGAQPSTSACDIYTYYGTPCVGAYSMDRALYSRYAGPLYQVKRSSDGTQADIGLQATGGRVKAADQDSFCASTSCTVTMLYDQSPQGNDLSIAPGGGAAPGADKGADATALPITIGGDKAYGLKVTPGTGYRDNNTRGVAVNGEPEGMYMVASGTNVNDGCCYDFGNAETNTQDTGNGHMDAVNLGTKCYFSPCTGSGPWVEADLENGLFSGDNGSNLANKGNSSNFVTALLKNDGQTKYALKGGDSQSGGLSTWWDGGLPTRGGYKPMQQEGAIILGIGGDNSNSSAGSFFEGVMTAGYPSDTADNAVQANIVAAGYAGKSGGTAAAGATAPSAAGQAVVHDGYSSVYSVDSANGHLQETYLPHMGDQWVSQDLSAKYGTPPVMVGTQPVSLIHCGYTSVYTVDAATGDLRETYLTHMGDVWSSQDLSAKYGAPPTNVTPTAVEHYAGASGTSAGCGYTSVYTANRNGDLQETYLSNTGFPGNAWVSQNLSAKYGAPPVQPGTSPVAIIHCGYTSVYTADASKHHLWETYLPAIGGDWHSQDLSAKYSAPPTAVTPTAVVHTAGASGATDDCGYTSVYTVDLGSQHLQETYLPNAGFPGDDWISQDLSAKYKTPQVAPGTAPTALVHLSYTSVYTVDQGSNEVQETYLPAIGRDWASQSLSKGYGTPKTNQTPIVLLHPDTAGVLDYASVYTVGEYNAHLEETYLPNVGFPGDDWITQDLSAKYSAPPVYVRQSSPASWSVVHDGYTSSFTVGDDGHLNETYLTAMGQPWVAQDLTVKYNVPKVEAGTAPVALYHDGYTSVFTVDASNHHLRESYLPAAASTGASWKTQDLSATFGTPPVAPGSVPAAVFHDGYVSVYTLGTLGDLQETYLPSAGFPGDPWVNQSLSGKYGAPLAKSGTSPDVIVHDGYVSVFTVDGNAAGRGDLQETFLPSMGAAWQTHDLSAIYGTPRTAVTPTAVFHDGYTSVYTVGNQGDLQESFLDYMGDAWTVQNLTANYGVPKALNIAPAALFHNGYTSVYYLTGPNDHLEEAYLPAMSGAWGSQDLSSNFGTPSSVQGPSPLVHYDTSGGLTYTSVYTTGSSDAHLEETYLPDDGFPGNDWVTQDLSAKYSAAEVDPPGRPVYLPSLSSEGLGYARMIRLEYAGSDNGTLLATFEHSAGNGLKTNYEIQRSTDNGATWSTQVTVPGDIDSYAPFLYEFPQDLGTNPAGTLMLLGNTESSGNTKATIREWLSWDHGRSWISEGVVQSASGGPGSGVWEPFVTLDKSGNLAMFFSDERQFGTYAQFLGEIISTNGGLTWTANADGSTNFGPGEIKVVASPYPADRPGMATVAPIAFGAGGYILSYEMCGPQDCAVHTKTSTDADNWGSGPTDLGTVATTSDGLILKGTPFITFLSNGGAAGGTLYLSGRKESSVSGSVPQNQTIVLTNSNGGTGSWSWIPAPGIPTVGADTSLCNTNYSPNLLRSPDNQTLYYAVAAAVGPLKCGEIMATVPVWGVN